MQTDLKSALMAEKLWMLSCLVIRCITRNQCWLLRFVVSSPPLLVYPWSSVSILLLWLLHLLKVNVTGVIYGF